MIERAPAGRGSARPRRLQRIRLGLLWNALRWRAGSSVVFFAIALLAVAAATGGPVYLAAADQSVLEHVVVPAAPEAIGLVATEQPGQAVTQAAFRRNFATLPRSPSGRVFFERPIYTELAGSEILSRARKPRPIAVADVVSRSSFCQHLVFAAGSCPRRSNEIALSTRSASYLHIALDQIVGLSLAGSDRRYRVAGLYRPGSSSAEYWWGTDYFEFGSALHGPPRMDAIFVYPAALAGLNLAQVTLSADVPVNAGGLLSTELPAFRAALGSEELRLGRAGLQATSRIGSLLANVASQQQAMTTTIAVIDLQLLLLVLMVLFGIAGRTAAERYQDLALADLRGLSPGSLWTVALREPFILIVAAAPIGAALGWLVAIAIGHARAARRGPRGVRFACLRGGSGCLGRRPRRHRGRLSAGSPALGGAGRDRTLAPRHRPHPRRRSLRRCRRTGGGRAAFRVRSRQSGGDPAARRPRARSDRARRRRDRRPAGAARLPRLSPQPCASRREWRSRSPCSGWHASPESSASR